MEHEQNVKNVATESLYYTSIQKPTSNDAPSNARVFPTMLKEYQSEDIREVKRQGQIVKYVKKGKGNKLGEGAQAIGIYEVVVDTGVEHVGMNPRYRTYAAKVFKGGSSDSLHGQWPELVHGLSEHYGGYVCEFYGYCRNYKISEGSNEDSEDDYETASESDFDQMRFDESYKTSFENDYKTTFESNFDQTRSNEGFKASSENNYETASESNFDQTRSNESYKASSESGSFCLLMRKYDCSLRNVLDEEMKKNHETGRPLVAGVAVNMMVNIAMGMKILHQENIIHRDLKAANVFVYNDAIDNMPWGAYIGDFDDAESTCGTAYWRAPEILEAIAKRRIDDKVKISWTSMVDVYSYGMTCYEILTGGIPLQWHPKTQYQDVIQGGLRPVLPTDLNPTVKNLIVRCWHQDPLQRPTFDDILLEWRKLLHEIPEFLKSLDALKNLMPLRNMPPIEECISRLERQFEDLRSKYPMQFFVRKNEVDFVKMGFHFVKCLKRVVRKFGYKPYIEHPSLPWSQWFARLKWIEKLWRLTFELCRALPFIEEKIAITKLRSYILSSICEGCEDHNSWTEEEDTDVSQRVAKMTSWNENLKKRPTLENRHFGCIQKYKHGHYEGNKDYPICSFCKVKKKVGPKPTFRLFDNKFANDTR